MCGSIAHRMISLAYHYNMQLSLNVKMVPGAKIPVEEPPPKTGTKVRLIQEQHRRQHCDAGGQTGRKNKSCLELRVEQRPL